ncbi:acyloxyacyl hydrolase [Flammeovirgaceae bacterium SG7u.111]|nr:acyloxyacyl hydrolase [Flammeovirgaceae bacterium SG7u.132]WPO36726.1 acyloxyacyl hydrolase [Flammeovirgaceae bacterium SG7u.111]
MRRFIYLFLFFISIQVTVGQDNPKPAVFIQPELMLGKLLPTNSNFPETSTQQTYVLSVGKINYNPESKWAAYYGYPTTGLSLTHSVYGNKEVFGSGTSLMSFVSFRTSKSLKNSLHLKFGLGASYFSQHHDPEMNLKNIVIGSSFTWAFQGGVYYLFHLRPGFSLKAGLSYLHHSNGHTQLPNFGMNSAVASLAAQFYLSPLSEHYFKPFEKPELEKTKDFYLSLRTGLGMHELGGADGPVGTDKKAVYSMVASGSKVVKSSLRLSAGAAYRFYQSYYDYINDNQPEEYIGNPRSSASNVYIFLGTEFLFGQVSLDVEGGINLYKPFYKKYYELYEPDPGFEETIKTWIVTRFGLKFYAINTVKNPRNNIYLGAHINANQGQADFTEVSLGYLLRLGAL